LKEAILALRAQGWSYRQIAAEVGLHWTRVGQIVREIDNKRASIR
jgi:DNA-directed RNA polymerase specialized sigma24 family protein